MHQPDTGDRGGEGLEEALGRMCEGALELPPPRAGFEERLAGQTAGVVRARAGRRRLLLGAGLGLAYAAGALTALGLAGRGDGKEGGTPGEPFAAVPAPAATLSRPSTPEAMAADLKRRGDRYLAETGDVRAALACYRQYLELVSLRGAPPYDPGDSWLLTALKQDRL